MTDRGVAVIGPGAIADAHLAAFAEIGGARPLWAIGRDPDRTSAFAARWEISHTGTDIRQALADPHVDVALICSPNALHAGQAAEALRAGKDVIVEIPMSLSAEDAQMTVDLAQECGRRVFACHTMRSFAGIRHLHDLIASGRESVTQVAGFFAIPRRNNEGFSGTRTWVDDLLWHHACHLVDATLWVTGRDAIEAPTLLRGDNHAQFGMTMDLTMSFVIAGDPRVIASHSLTYNASTLCWQMRFCGLRGDYVFDNGNLFGTGGELLIEGASIRDLRFQNSQILHGLRTGAQTDFEGRDVLPSMRALRLLDKAGDR